MAVSDWLTNLFPSSDKMRGLSGGAGSAVALDDANSFYNYRLRRHYTEDHIPTQPARLWFTHDDPQVRTGLGAHLIEAIAEGQRFTDVLIVLSEDDQDDVDKSLDFERNLRRMVREQYNLLLREQNLPLKDRPLGVHIVRDASPQVGNTDFGMMDGEFITGIIPNQYGEAGETSQAVVAINLYIPGVSENYSEMGRFYDDQVMFTLGNSWLDNITIPSLREAALYRLGYGEDGSFVHMINPDLQSAYTMRTEETEGGTNVITLATREGTDLAKIVLAILESPEEAQAEAEVAPLPASHPDDGVPTEPAVAATPQISAPMMGDDFEVEFSSRAPSSTSRGGRTILPEAHHDRIFTLQERGVLFQKVHFHKFMLGYDVLVGTRGEVGTFVKQCAATFEIRTKSVSLIANADNVAVNGEHLPMGEGILIVSDAVIEIGNQRLEYHDLSSIPVDGWPYVGEIRRPASSTYMLWGRAYTVGRSRESRVVLPDEKRQDNIIWKPGIIEGSKIKSKKGDIDKEQFYTDSIMVSAEHAAFDLSSSMPEVETRSSGAYSFVRRGSEIIPVYPAKRDDMPNRTSLQPGDEVMVGNCLFHISYTPEDGDDAVAQSTHTKTVAAPSAPPSADSLVDLVSAPAAADLEEAPAPDDVPPVPRRNPFADLGDDPAPPHFALPPSAPAQAEFIEHEQPATPAPDPATHVRVVDDHEAQFELGRPARLVQVGWSLHGTATLGNHTGCDLVIPENRIVETQDFPARDYLSLRVRGRKSSLTPGKDSSEVLLNGEPLTADLQDLSSANLEVIRRDEDGDIDFTIRLSLAADAMLPDPRAQLLSIDTTDDLSIALLTRGLPRQVAHTTDLNGLQLTATFQGEQLVITDYLDSYRQADGSYRAFFVAPPDQRLVTAPENGVAISLVPGSRLVVDGAVFRFEIA